MDRRCTANHQCRGAESSKGDDVARFNDPEKLGQRGPVSLCPTDFLAKDDLRTSRPQGLDLILRLLMLLIRNEHDRKRFDDALKDLGLTSFGIARA
jgi:hypothetical protein